MILGPDDYLVMPTIVHVMRYRGLNDDGHRYWSTACGCSISEESWERAWEPLPEQIDSEFLTVCRTCAKTKPAPQPHAP